MSQEKEPKQISITSPDGREARITELRRLFPDLFDGEGVLDEKALRQLASEEAGHVTERFRFEWAGKSQSKRFAFAPSKATLIYDPERSVNADGTTNKASDTLADNTSQNLIIEGDNLEVLKLLQASYFEKIKCIYIDPPYNTGNDFIYPDDYSQNLKDYWETDGTKKAGVRLKSISESSGRRHSEWLNFMQSRLLLARNMLLDDGVIFITIDDNEYANIKKLMDEIFGEENFISNIVWKHTQQSKNDEKYFSRQFNYVLCYSKSSELESFRLDRTEENNKNYSNPDNDPKGEWRAGDVRSPNFRGTLRYDIVSPTNTIISPPENGWRWSKKTVEQKISTGEIIFSPDNSKIIRKIYLSDQSGRTPENLWLSDIAGTTREANSELKSIFDGTAVFDTPKPILLIKHILSLLNIDDYTVLDFFAGSGTTAHAVLDKNMNEGCNIRYICIQIPEIIDVNSDAWKAGYRNISDITIDRVRRVGQKIRSENPKAQGDTGFRVLRLDVSHFPENTFAPDPDKSEDENIKALEEHLTAAAQLRLFDADEFHGVVTEIALKNGFGLFYSLESLDEFNANAVYRLSGNDKSAILCLDAQLDGKTIEALKDHSDYQLIVLKAALDTTKKFELQTAFKDNLWVV